MFVFDAGELESRHSNIMPEVQTRVLSFDLNTLIDPGCFKPLKSLLDKDSFFFSSGDVDDFIRGCG